MVRHFGHLERNSSLNQIKYVLGSIVKYIVAFSYCFLLSLAFFPRTVTSLTRKFQTQERYIIICLELTLSFLIGRKRTVNFRNQRPGCHLAADDTIIVSRTLKVTGNHVMYDRGA